MSDALPGRGDPLPFPLPLTFGISPFCEGLL